MRKPDSRPRVNTVDRAASVREHCRMLRELIGMSAKSLYSI
jgi:hypothetical protein